MRALAEREREVTALFYIDGYSHRDIAGFLEVPETTVNNRLHSARERLREEVMTMVAEELRSRALPPEFSHEVRALLERPRPLEIEGHPVRRVWEAIRAALPDYEVVAGEEVVERDDLLPAFADRAYHVGDSKALRTEMTMVTMAAMRGRTPPVRLLAAGRVFRPDAEDAWHSPVFHQVDALCIEPGAGVERLKAVLTDVLTAVLGELELRWTGHEHGIVDEGMAPAIRHGDDWLEVAGCGLLKAEDLRAAGYDPGAVQGFAFGMGLERLAMQKHGIGDIRQLWEPPYVPE